MDQIKTGKYIAKLRKEKGLTQEALGDLLGVSNKTVSRWETGIYMPDIETLSLLSKYFGCSIEELLSGEKTETSFDAPLTEPKKDPFTLEERRAFWKKNFLRENRSWFILWGIIFILIIIFALGASITAHFLIGIGFGALLKYWAALFVALTFYVIVIRLYFYNKMCIYVDNNAYKLSK